MALVGTIKSASNFCDRSDILYGKVYGSVQPSSVLLCNVYNNSLQVLKILKMKLKLLSHECLIMQLRVNPTFKRNQFTTNTQPTRTCISPTVQLNYKYISFSRGSITYENTPKFKINSGYIKRNNTLQPLQ